MYPPGVVMQLEPEVRREPQEPVRLPVATRSATRIVFAVEVKRTSHLHSVAVTTMADSLEDVMVEEEANLLDEIVDVMVGEAVMMEATETEIEVDKEAANARTVGRHQDHLMGLKAAAATRSIECVKPKQ